MKNNILFIVDPQNDFVDATNGTLYIPGAQESVKKLSTWIIENKENIDRIVISQDTHPKYHIGHSCWWKEEPKPFTQITAKEVREGKYHPKFDQFNKSILANPNSDPLYLMEMEDDEEKGLIRTIWPEHCLEGSWGAALPDCLVNALGEWQVVSGRRPFFVQKGYFPLKEAYSVFSYSEICDSDVDRLEELLLVEETGKIYIAGYAKDICLAESLKDLFRLSEDSKGYNTENPLKDKIHFLEFGMVALDEKNPSLEIYEKYMKELGAVWEI